MITTKHGRPTGAGGAMGRDQDGRVDFKASGGVVRDIGGGNMAGDPFALSDQQSTYLAIGRGLRQCDHMSERGS